MKSNNNIPSGTSKFSKKCEFSVFSVADAHYVFHFSDGPYLTLWPRLVSITNLISLEMTEPCASPAMYVWYAGNQQMNPGQSMRDTHHPVHLSEESTLRMSLYQVLLTRQLFFFQVKWNIDRSIARGFIMLKTTKNIWRYLTLLLYLSDSE